MSQAMLELISNTGTKVARKSDDWHHLASLAFEEFWKWYPRRVGKPLARAKFFAVVGPGGMATRTLDKDSGQYVEIHLEATPDELIEGAKKLLKKSIDPKTNCVRDGGRYIPHPATYLNQGRWLDDDA